MTIPRKGTGDQLQAGEWNELATLAEVAMSTALQGPVAGGSFNVKDPRFGAKGDGATDDTAALQAAVSAAEAQIGPATYSAGMRAGLFFPPGVYKITAPIVVLKPISIQAAPNTALVAPTHNGAAFQFKISHEGTDYKDVFGAPLVTVAGLGVAGSKTAGSSQNAFLMDRAATNPIYYGLILENVRVSNMGGSGFAHSASGYVNGFARGNTCYFAQCAAYGIDLANAWDTRWVSCEIAVNGAGVRQSGGGGHEFYGCNNYANAGYGLTMYATTGGECSLKWVGGSIDGNGAGNVYFDVRLAGKWAKFIGCSINTAGPSGSPNT